MAQCELDFANISCSGIQVGAEGRATTSDAEEKALPTVIHQFMSCHEIRDGVSGIHLGEAVNPPLTGGSWVAPGMGHLPQEYDVAILGARFVAQ